MLSELQKATSIEFLRGNEYKKAICFEYEQFIDNKEPFTDFCCQRIDGNEKYLDIIELIKKADVKVKFFVEVYGLEDADEVFIYADTLILSTILSKDELNRTFELCNEKQSEYLSPSSIARESAESIKDVLLLDINGNLACLIDKFSKCELKNLYSFWWD